LETILPPVFGKEDNMKKILFILFIIIISSFCYAKGQKILAPVMVHAVKMIKGEGH